MLGQAQHDSERNALLNKCVKWDVAMELRFVDMGYKLHHTLILLPCDIRIVRFLKGNHAESVSAALAAIL